MIFFTSLAILVSLVGALYFKLTRTKTTQDKKRRIAKRVNIKIRDIENAPQVMSYLKQIDAYAFEELLLDAFKARGFKIIRNARYSGDGGVDGRVIIQGHTFFIQAKRYDGYIKPADVRALNELCKAHDTFGLFIHTGKTGPAAKGYNHDRIGIISGDSLVSFLKGSQPLSVPLNQRYYINL